MFHTISRRLVPLIIITVAGCVNIPKEKMSIGIDKTELSEHVYFLAQPALGGRLPRSIGSWEAREYIKTRFAAYQLKPWGTSKGYDQPFRIGTNVVGMLPGQDPRLKNEVVIVSAHYDHVGKGDKGRICPGAADNASGVAALLEIAEQMSMAKDKPRRTVCFAAFDCEESFLVGSFAFTCRKDFDPAKVIALVNIDMLGRDFLDTVDHSLFVSGTEYYPELRRTILRTGETMSLHINPIGTDLVGPRGDFVPFITCHVPCLNFSCGESRDYHKATDLANRLNYETMDRQVKVIAQTVSALVNRNSLETRVPPRAGDREELQGLLRILDRIGQSPKTAGLNEKEAKEIKQLNERANSFLAHEPYTLTDRDKLSEDIKKPLLCVLSRMSDTTPPNQMTDLKNTPDNLLSEEVFVKRHPEESVEAFRKIIRYFLESNPGLFTGAPACTATVQDLAEDKAELKILTNNQYQLRIPILRRTTTITLAFNAKINGLLSFQKITFDHIIYRTTQEVMCQGTQEEIIDFCLMEWRTSLRDQYYHLLFNQFLRQLTKNDTCRTSEQWLRWHLDRKKLKTENEWLVGLLKTRNQDILLYAITYALPLLPFEEKQILLCSLIQDHNFREEVRWNAIMCCKEKNKALCLALINILNEKRKPAFPLPANLPIITLLPSLKDAAYAKLKELTGKDFGRNQTAWKRWVAQNLK
jgi:hypothetical protein